MKKNAFDMKHMQQALRVSKKITKKSTLLKRRETQLNSAFRNLMNEYDAPDVATCSSTPKRTPLRPVRLGKTARIRQVSNLSAALQRCSTRDAKDNRSE